MLIDTTFTDPTPRLPVWEWSTPGGKVGWTADNFPAVQRGGAWVLGETGWRPLDEKKEKFITDLPEAPPATTSSSTRPEFPIFTDKDGTRYYDGQKTLRIVARDGTEVDIPFPDAPAEPSQASGADPHVAST